MTWITTQVRESPALFWEPCRHPVRATRGASLADRRAPLGNDLLDASPAAKWHDPIECLQTGLRSTLSLTGLAGSRNEINLLEAIA